VKSGVTSTLALGFEERLREEGVLLDARAGAKQRDLGAPCRVDEAARAGFLGGEHVADGGAHERIAIGLAADLARRNQLGGVDRARPQPRQRGARAIRC
jgi:hypothetical protein